MIKVRERGIIQLGLLKLPAPRQAVMAADLAGPTGAVDPPQIERLLRLSVERLGGGRLGSCASLMFGFEDGTRGDKPKQLRQEAAERWGISEGLLEETESTDLRAGRSRGVAYRAGALRAPGPPGS